MSNLFSFFRTRRETVNLFSRVFLIVYFYCIMLPYLFARVPVLNSVFSNSTVGYVLRFFHLFFFVIVGCLLYISNDLRPKVWILIPCLLLIVLNALVILLGPDSIISYSSYFSAKIAIKQQTIGIYEKFVHIARFAGDVIVFFFLFTAYVFAFTKLESLTNILLPAVVVAVAGVVYSLIFERATMSAAWNGGSPEAVRSIFHSKNAYGIFLFSGSAVCAFAFFADRRKWTKFLLLLMPIFLAMSLIINCKLVFVCILVMAIGSYVLATIVFFKKKLWVSITLMAVPVLLSSALLLLFSVPSFHEQGFTKVLFDNINKVFTNLNIESFLGRTSEWAIVPRMVRGIYIVTGYPSPTGYQVIMANTSVNGAIATNLYDLHNAYIDFYAYHGLFGLVGLASIYAWVIYQIVLCFKTNVRHAILLSILFLTSILFGMAETYTLFVSMSANTFALSLILLVAPSLMKKKEKAVS